jgi:hypothetical protein
VKSSKWDNLNHIGNPKSLRSVLKNCRKRAAGNEPIVPAPVIAEEEEELYCICRMPNDCTRSMIQCDSCEEWFHFRCVGVDESGIDDNFLYVCSKCTIAK